MDNAVRYSDHRDKAFRRAVLRATAYPVCMVLPYTSPEKNRWLVIYHASSKADIGDNCLITPVCIYRDASGRQCATMPVFIRGKFKLLLFPFHFFSRYRERCGLSIGGEELIRHYFARNYSYAFSVSKSGAFCGAGNAGILAVTGSCLDGVAMGAVTQLGNYLLRTFIRYDMARGEQTDTFSKNEKLRRKNHDKNTK